MLSILPDSNSSGIKPGPIQVDAFHVVKLGLAVVDEIRRRVQQGTFDHRDRAGDPLNGICHALQIGAERLTERQITGSSGSRV